MKVSNIDIIDTGADEKKLNRCLIQGWCYKKSLSTVPKSENYVIERCQRLTLRSVSRLSVSNLMFIFSLRTLWYWVFYKETVKYYQ